MATSAAEIVSLPRSPPARASSRRACACAGSGSRRPAEPRSRPSLSTASLLSTRTIWWVSAITVPPERPASPRDPAPSRRARCSAPPAASKARMIARPSTRNSSSGNGTPSARAARCTSGTSGRAASNAVMVSRAAVPVRRPPARRRDAARRCGSCGSRPTRRASSASASSWLPLGRQHASRDRSPDRHAPARGAAPRAAAPPRPPDRRARRSRSTRASTLPPHADQRRLQPRLLGEGAPVLGAAPQRLDHRARYRLETRARWTRPRAPPRRPRRWRRSPARAP